MVDRGEGRRVSVCGRRGRFVGCVSKGLSSLLVLFVEDSWRSSAGELGGCPPGTEPAWQLRCRGECG
jgi:hypothetical protein